MTRVNQVLLILHFLGVALALSWPIVTILTGRLVASSAPAERAALARVHALMGHAGSAGLVLLWASGLALVFSRWGGFGALPGMFHAKVTAVVVLTGVVGFTHALQKRARLGDASAPATLARVGRVNLLLGVAIVVLAVLTFD